MSRTFGITACFLLGLVAIETFAILRTNEGRFLYTLDDPYIHLALAENVLRGHYGVNLGEVSAPSSSILWPFLLVPFARLPFAGLVPLAINLVAALATVSLFARFAGRIAPPERFPGASIALASLFVVGTNTVGLVFTGMEHSVQLLGSMAIVWGLVREKESGRAPGWLGAVLVLAPLVRFENLAVSGAAILYLLVRGHRNLALGTGAAIALSLAAFAFYLHSLGLGLVPTSVIAKSGPVARSGSWRAIGGNALFALGERQGGFLALGGLLALRAAFLRTRSRAEKLFAGAIALWIAGHFCAGRFGWYHRYEAYAWGASLAGLAELYRRPLRRGFEALGNGGLLLPAGIVAAAAFPYLVGLVTIPLATGNIYRQHYQMHRFATEYWKGPIAVNDLGWVSWRNDEYVLDLWGLASREALLRRRFGDDGIEWMRDLAARHDTRLAMLYEDWLPEMPAEWEELGRMHLTGELVSAAKETVTFWALDPAAVPEGKAALARFRESLPDGVIFEAAGEERQPRAYKKW